MSIHRVNLIYSETGSTSFNAWLDTWLTNMDSWAPEPNDVPTFQDPDYPSLDPHYRGDLIFEWTEDKAIIPDQLDGYLDSYCPWHRIGYHVCDHDEDDPDGCSWDEQRESGQVPEWVPDFA